MGDTQHMVVCADVQAYTHSYVHTWIEVHVPKGPHAQRYANTYAQYLHIYICFQTKDPEPTGPMKVDIWANSTSHTGFTLGV